MKLVVDAGATKTHWFYMDEKGKAKELFGPGINPSFQNSGQIVELLWPTLSGIANEVSQVYYFGAGADAPERKETLEIALREIFISSYIMVAGDMLGACYSLTGKEPAVCCILGTGSNAALFEDMQISKQPVSLGFWLGDEGSGGYFGKHLLERFFKNKLPNHLQEAFALRYPELNLPAVLERLYKQASPNAFAASFTHFLAQYQSDAYVFNFLKQGFILFLEEMVLPLDAPHLPVHFTGSVALHFEKPLKAALEEKGLQIGIIEPMRLSKLYAALSY